MTIPRWKVALEDLGLSAPKPTDPPAGESGKWFDAQTRFERRGFVRILVKEGDALHWHIEAAHPALTTGVLELAVAALRAQSGGEWAFEQTDDAHFTLNGEASEEHVQKTIVPLLLFADAVAADRDNLGDLEERLVAHAEPEEVEEVEEAEEAENSEPESSDTAGADGEEAGDDGKREDGETTAEGASPDQAASPFESIGSEEPRPLATEPVFEIRVTQGQIEIGMGLPYPLDAATYDQVIAAWSRSLRGRYDVTASALEPDSDRAIDLSGSASRVMLLVKPDAITGKATIEDIAPGLHDHIDTLEKVAAAGIDPLVFLGVHDRNTAAKTAGTKQAAPKTRDEEEKVRGPFESIGDDSDAQELDDDGSHVLLVEPDPEDDDPGGLILDLSAPPSEGDPLQRGKFDDPRLQMSDATTQLVDVVLRHPGYSDRRIGQVLSILLSVDYADALELADSAPRVIAWGVGNERANTMKTVIEGAGGRVVLVEPDTFSPR